MKYFTALFLVLPLMAQLPVSVTGGGGSGAVASVTGSGGIVTSPTTGPVVVSPDTSILQTKMLCVGSASATAPTCTMSITSYVNGDPILFIPGASCTGAPTTLTVNALSALGIYEPNGTTSASCLIGVPIWLTITDSGTKLRRQVSKVKQYIQLYSGQSNSGGTAVWSGGWNSWSTTGATQVATGSGNAIIEAAAMTQSQQLNSQLMLPPNWDGGTVNLYLSFYPSTGGTNNQIVTFQLANACDPASNAISYGSANILQVTITNATGGTMYNTGALVLPTSGCVAGHYFQMLLSRNGTGETLTQTVNIVHAILEYAVNLN